MTLWPSSSSPPTAATPPTATDGPFYTAHLSLLLLCALSLLHYESRLSRSLTSPPQLYYDDSSVLISRLLSKLTGEYGILSRKIVPALFVGTRGSVSSLVAYLARGTSGRSVREVLTLGADGAKIVLEWELPLEYRGAEHGLDLIRDGISVPVVLLVHGMNNDSTFGYIRSMMKTATSRGWIAVCMNLRGQDGLGMVKNSTPRSYNAGYTGDLRGVIVQLERRLEIRTDEDGRVVNVGGPMFLVGYSLGANIITKYLGEESLHGTLPRCIAGGAALGNPLHIASGSIPFPMNMILALGVKKSILQNLPVYRRHHDRGFQKAVRRALWSRTIGEVDHAFAPYLLRNEGNPPFAPRVGYRDGREYWWDSSSHRYVGHVSVPLLKITARDDFLVFGQFSRKLNHCLENPNVIVVKTRCGGHLGWQESPPPSKRMGADTKSSWWCGETGSWSDAAVADFIEALLEIRQEDESNIKMGKDGFNSAPVPNMLSRL